MVKKKLVVILVVFALLIGCATIKPQPKDHYSLIKLGLVTWAVADPKIRPALVKACEEALKYAQAQNPLGAIDALLTMANATPEQGMLVKLYLTELYGKQLEQIQQGMLAVISQDTAKMLEEVILILK